MHQGILNRLKGYLDRNRLGELLVLSGAITPHQLRYALVQQKATNTPLGHVLMQQEMIRRPDLYQALAQQWTLRALTAAVTIMISMSAFGIKPARAGGIGDIPQQIALANTANAAFTPVAYYPPLFGSAEKMSSNLRPFTKWTQMFDRFQASMSTAEGRREVAALKDDLEPLRGQPLQVMAERVNAIMNKVPYIEDNKNWGTSDYWETPVEFLSRGGDCEDFAIAKYSSLRALGVPEERLRVAIVKDLQKGIPHAVLIVYTDDGAVILDNQSRDVKSADSLADRYKPIFSINREGWWLHSAPRDTQLASVQ